MRNMLSVCLLALFTLSSHGNAAPGRASDSSSTGAMVASATIIIDGTSTLHDYRVTTGVIAVDARLAQDAASLLGQGALESFDVKIPVNSFTSEKDGLKKHFLKALRADAHPFIEFKLQSYTLDPPASGIARGRVTGVLTVAGVQRPIDLVLDAQETAGGVRVHGSHSLLMTQFGIQPPSLMLGMLKTADQVKVTFDLELSTKGS